MAEIDLSIVIPILDEEHLLPDLFAELGRQRGVDFELILADGGSTDGTREQILRLSASLSFPCFTISSPSGRGRQLNAGARLARGETLLFLHADSRFPNPNALCRGREALSQRIVARGDHRVAGRFALRFDRVDQSHGMAYHFYEEKARLNRPGCIYGDQGFLLRREYFEEIGPFDQSLPYLEDARLATQVRRTGEWLLLPAQIVTSARRFEREGFWERQTLNALILNFADIGWNEYLNSVPELYRCQNRGFRLDLLPFFEKVGELALDLPLGRRLMLWYRTGGFVRRNVWMVAFARDMQRQFLKGRPSSPEKAPVLKWFDRWIDPLIAHSPVDAVLALLTWVWFRAKLRRLRRSRTNPHPRAAGKGV